MLLQVRKCARLFPCPLSLKVPNSPGNRYYYPHFPEWESGAQDQLPQVTQSVKGGAGIGPWVQLTRVRVLDRHPGPPSRVSKGHRIPLRSSRSTVDQDQCRRSVIMASSPFWAMGISARQEFVRRFLNDLSSRWFGSPSPPGHWASWGDCPWVLPSLAI